MLSGNQMTNQIELLKDVRRPIPGYEGIYSITGSGLLFRDARVAITVTGVHRPRKEKQMKFTQVENQIPYVSLKLTGIHKYWNVAELLHLSFPEYTANDIAKVCGVGTNMRAISRITAMSKTMSNEEWRVAASLPFLLVSNLGRIKRPAHSYVKDGKVIRVKEIFVPIRDFGCYGWSVCGFSVVHEGKQYGNVRLPRLVYEAFIGALPKHAQIRYRDGDYRNVTVTNIYVKSK